MITIVSSTNRKGSNTLKVALECQQLLKEMGVESRFIDLAKLPPAFPYVYIDGGKMEEIETLIATHIDPVQKFLFVIPEYNGGFPGILKAFMDSVHPRYFKGKKAALIGLASGHAGALRPLDHFTAVLHYLQVEVLADKPKLSGIEHLLDTEGKFIQPETGKRITAQMEKFLRF